MPLHLLENPAAVSLHHLFDQPQLGFVVDAMQAGNSPAKIWVDDVTAPRSAFLWDKTHSLYAGGDTGNADFNDGLRQLIDDVILPEAEREDLGMFKVYANQPEWVTLLWNGTGELQKGKRRSLFVLNADDYQPANALLENFSLHPITPELLNNLSLKNIDNLREEIGSCWNSLDQFLAAGFGFCLLHGSDEIVAWCTAEYVSGKTCGVGIETVEEFQGRGLATLAARAFAGHALQGGWTVHWDSWFYNTPSIMVAQKAGFRKVLDYSITLWLLES